MFCDEREENLEKVTGGKPSLRIQIQRLTSPCCCTNMPGESLLSISQGKAGLLELCDDFARVLLKALIERGSGESTIHLFLPLTCYVKLV